MHLNVTVSPLMMVFCEALVVSLAPSGLSKNVNQNQNLNLCLFQDSHISSVVNHNPL